MVLLNFSISTEVCFRKFCVVFKLPRTFLHRVSNSIVGGKTFFEALNVYLISQGLQTSTTVLRYQKLKVSILILAYLAAFK